MAGIIRGFLLLQLLSLFADGIGPSGFKQTVPKLNKDESTLNLIKQVLAQNIAEVWGVPDKLGVHDMYTKFKNLLNLTNSLQTRVEALERALKNKCNAARKGDPGENPINSQDKKIDEPADIIADISAKDESVKTTDDQDKGCHRGPKGQKGAKGDPGPSLKAPTIITKSQVKWLDEGDYLQLSCAAKGYPLPSLSLTNSSALTTRIEKDGKQILLKAYKRNATLSDVKIYRCRAKSVLGEVEITFDVKLRVSPRIFMKAKFAFGRVGASVELPSCNVLAIPPAKITWSRAYGALPSDSYFRDKHQILGINTARFEDSGFYFCQAENNLGKTKVSVQLIITNEKFRMSIVPPTVVFIDSSVNLTCAARGYPTPYISWFYGESKISQVTYFHPRKDETVACITAKSLGNYSCVASSGGQIIRNNVEATDTSFPSTILKNHRSLKAKLIQWLEETPNFSRRWKVCYNSLNDFSSYSFLRQCGHYNQTVIVIQVGNSIFGGYSDVRWRSVRYLRYNRYKASNQSFLFSLRREGFWPVKLGVRAYKNKEAIYQAYQDNNFWFGAGPDLKLPTYRQKTISSNLGNTYESPYGACCARNWFFNQRDYTYNVSRIEALYAVDLFA